MYTDFNGFNQTAIVLRYSAHIKTCNCKTIKTIKTENITHKHKNFEEKSLYAKKTALSSQKTTTLKKHLPIGLQ